MSSATTAVEREFSPGTILFRERDPGDRMYVIRSGRVKIYRETADGELVLAFLGPGEFLGTRQHGRLIDLRVADLMRDVKLLAVAREVARETVRRDPLLRRHAALAAAVEARWGDRLSLAEVG